MASLRGSHAEDDVVKWLKRGSSLGNLDALTWLGNFYLTSERHRNCDLAESYLRDAATMGGAQAKAILADYLIENPIPERRKDGVELLFEAANANVSSALMRLSELYGTGRLGFPLDAEKSDAFAKRFVEAINRESTL